MIKKTGLAIVLGSISLLFLLALPGFAQQHQQRQQLPPVSDSDLSKAANAYVEITGIQEEFQQSIQQAGNDKEKIQQLQREANADMIEAVEEEGLDAERYNQIIQSVRADEDLSDKFLSKVEKAR